MLIIQENDERLAFFIGATIRQKKGFWKYKLITPKTPKKALLFSINNQSLLSGLHTCSLNSSQTQCY